MSKQEEVKKTQSKEKEKPKKKPATPAKKRVDTSPRTKNVTIAKVKREAAEANRMETYELNDTDRIRYYPIFPQLKINEMLQELSDVMEQASKLEIVMSDELTMNHVLFLTIKHFTHFKRELSDDFGEQLQQLEWLIDTRLFSTILNDIFRPTELAKIMDSLGGIVSTDLFIKQVEGKAMEELESLQARNADMMNVFDTREVDRVRALYKDDLKDVEH